MNVVVRIIMTGIIGAIVAVPPCLVTKTIVWYSPLQTLSGPNERYLGLEVDLLVYGFFSCIFGALGGAIAGAIATLGHTRTAILVAMIIPAVIGLAFGLFVTGGNITRAGTQLVDFPLLIACVGFATWVAARVAIWREQ